VAAATVAAGTLGVADADTPTAQPRTIEVKGSAARPVSSKASEAGIAQTYRDALATAVSSTRGKADFLAGQVGASITGVQSVTEQSETDDSACDDDYESVAAPMGGSGGAGTAPKRRRRPRNGGRPGAPGRTGTNARAARAPQCSVQADVTVAYAMS
jgi:hypothetical protein